MKKILISLTYYLPNISGVTIYAEILAKKLAGDNQVTILTSKFQRSLKTRESKNNLFIRRVWAPIKINKGIIMPLFPIISLNQVLKNDFDHTGIALNFTGDIDAPGDLAFRRFVL